MTEISTTGLAMFAVAFPVLLLLVFLWAMSPTPLFEDLPREVCIVLAFVTAACAIAAAPWFLS